MKHFATAPPSCCVYYMQIPCDARDIHTNDFIRPPHRPTLYPFIHMYIIWTHVECTTSAKCPSELLLCCCCCCYLCRCTPCVDDVTAVAMYGSGNLPNEMLSPWNAYALFVWTFICIHKSRAIAIRKHTLEKSNATYAKRHAPPKRE